MGFKILAAFRHRSRSLLRCIFACVRSYLRVSRQRVSIESSILCFPNINDRWTNGRFRRIESRRTTSDGAVKFISRPALTLFPHFRSSIVFLSPHLTPPNGLQGDERIVCVRRTRFYKHCYTRSGISIPCPPLLFLSLLSCTPSFR